MVPAAGSAETTKKQMVCMCGAFISLLTSAVLVGGTTVKLSSATTCMHLCKHTPLPTTKGGSFAQSLVIFHTFQACSLKLGQETSIRRSGKTVSMAASWLQDTLSLVTMEFVKHICPNHVHHVFL